MSLPKFASVDQLLAFAEQTHLALADMTHQRDEAVSGREVVAREMAAAARRYMEDINAALAQADALRKERDAAIERAVAEQYVALRQRVAELEQALGQTQWAATAYGWGSATAPCCPVCRGIKPGAVMNLGMGKYSEPGTGHTKDCYVRAALAQPAPVAPTP